jgi:hypothetical protein
LFEVCDRPQIVRMIRMKKHEYTLPFVPELLKYALVKCLLTKYTHSFHAFNIHFKEIRFRTMGKIAHLFNC